MINNTLMIQGTTSDAGKSTLVTGLCRVLKRQQTSVVPFKPQNMALNSAVTQEGGEIGRAQAVQAQACQLEPHTDMNPVLIKPSSDTNAQIIIHGKALTEMNARSFHDYKTTAMSAVLESHQRLTQQFDNIIVEGAGSPAEINLRDRDIANMGFAEAIDCPVILVADIDKGGVFAHIVGTLALLSDSEQQRIKGFIINRFRGDIALLQPGLDWLEQQTNKPVLGVIPYIHGLHLEAEDALNQESIVNHSETIKVIVPALPRISNHTDFDPLRLHQQVDFQYIGPGANIPDCDLVILPGSKSVRADLQWLTDHHWPDYIQRHLRYHGKLLGICGGFQMLGDEIHDPDGIEGESGSSKGLCYFEMQTVLQAEKQLHNKSGTLCLNNAAVSGYEIHAGISSGPALDSPAIKYSQHSDGAISDDRQIIGSYFHGLFNEQSACDALLQWAGLDEPRSTSYFQLREQSIDQLADTLEQHLDIEAIKQILQAEASPV